MMLAGVIRDAEEFKVCKSVIRLDAIAVVNVLARSEHSAKVRRHDDTMLKLEAVADTDGDVSIAANESTEVTRRFPAGLAAEAHGRSSGRSARLDAEFSTAMLADKLHRHASTIRTASSIAIGLRASTHPS